MLHGRPRRGRGPVGFGPQAQADAVARKTLHRRSPFEAIAIDGGDPREIGAVGLGAEVRLALAGHRLVEHPDEGLIGGNLDVIGPCARHRRPGEMKPLPVLNRARIAPAGRIEQFDRMVEPTGRAIPGRQALRGMILDIEADLAFENLARRQPVRLVVGHAEPGAAHRRNRAGSGELERAARVGHRGDMRGGMAIFDGKQPLDMGIEHDPAHALDPHGRLRGQGDARRIGQDQRDERLVAGGHQHAFVDHGADPGGPPIDGDRAPAALDDGAHGFVAQQFAREQQGHAHRQAQRIGDVIELLDHAIIVGPDQIARCEAEKIVTGPDGIRHERGCGRGRLCGRARQHGGHRHPDRSSLHHPGHPQPAQQHGWRKAGTKPGPEPLAAFRNRVLQDDSHRHRSGPA